MNTGLGLSFLRIVNEEGSNGWAQVYARIPFDNTDVLNKGALFGVIFGMDKEGWAEKDAELMGWVEEYFNKIESGGELSDFLQRWRSKYPELDGVWVWVVEREGAREIMMARSGEVGIALLRQEKEFDFSKMMVEGKVLKGKTEEGDRLVFWTNGLRERWGDKGLSDLQETEVGELGESLKNEGFASAGIVLDFQKFVEEPDQEYPDRMIVVSEKRPEPEEETSSDISRETELVDDKFVGPIGLKEKISNWWMKISPRFKRSVQGENIIERKDNSKRKKLAILLGVSFLILLVISLISGSIKMSRDAELKKWKDFSEPIEKSLSEATGLVQLNPSGARNLVQDSKTNFEVRQTDFEKGRYEKEVVILGKKIEDAWTLVSGEKESQVEELARIDLVRQGFKGDRMVLIKDQQVVVLDSVMGVIVTVETATKDIKVTAGKGEGLGWLDATGDSTKVMVLTGSGIRNAISGQDLVSFDAAVVKPITIGRFGGNIYLLDQGNKEIFKYASVGEGYGERARWLKQDQTMSIVPVDMAIDSDIWVVSEDGKVEKYRRGSKEQFSINGLTPGMRINRIAIEQEGDKLALLDSTSGAVAICSKSLGTCTQMLKSQRLREATDLEFDAKGNLLVLLPGVVGVLK